MPESPQFRADRSSFYDPAVEVTVTIRGLDGPDALTYTQRVSREFAVDEQLKTPVIEEAALHAVRKIVDKALAGAREEKREREKLELMLGGPATPQRMAAHLAQLLATPREQADGEADRG